MKQLFATTCLDQLPLQVVVIKGFLKTVLVLRWLSYSYGMCATLIQLQLWLCTACCLSTLLATAAEFQQCGTLHASWSWQLCMVFLEGNSWLVLLFWRVMSQCSIKMVQGWGYSAVSWLMPGRSRDVIVFDAFVQIKKSQWLKRCTQFSYV